MLHPSKRLSCFSEQQLIFEGRTIENSFDITETFNNYFANLGKTVADEILSTPPQTCKKYLSNRIQNSIFLEEPRPNEVYFNVIKANSCQKKMKFHSMIVNLKL